MQHAPGFLALCDDARTRVREVTIDDMIARLALGEAFELVDVREDLEWAAGHAQGAAPIATVNRVTPSENGAENKQRRHSQTMHTQRRW